jgi:tetratricopeptide (TPR) repeat protein
MGAAVADVPVECKTVNKREDLDRAIAACSNFLRRPGLSARDRAAAYSYRGSALLSKRQLDEALADGTRAIEADPKYDGGHYIRGNVYLRQGRFEFAVKELNRAIMITPTFALALSARCLAHLYREEPERAIADCNSAIEANPKLAAAYNNRGLYYANLKQHERALADYGRAIDINPKYSVSFSNRARTYLELDQLGSALTDVERTIELDPQNANAYRNRAAVRIKKGEQDRGLGDLIRAIDLDPVFVEAYVDRAEVYLKKNQWGPAIGDLRKSLSLPARKLRERDAQNRAAALLTSLTQKPQAPLPIPAVAPAPGPAPTSPGVTSSADGGRRVALVIGNSAYTHVGPLKNPANDGKLVSAALKRSGFAEVIEHYDLALAGMMTALKDFGDRAAAADWAIIYFAGHGIEMGGAAYLIPVDARLEKDAHVPDEAVVLDRMLQKAEAAKKLRLVILDACRNNPFVTRMARSGSSTRSIARGLPALEPEGDVLVAYATKHGTTALDGEGDNSPFALALAENIPVPNVDVRVMFGRVRDTVRKATKNQQEPYTYGSVGGDLLFFVASAR